MIRGVVRVGKNQNVIADSRRTIGVIANDHLPVTVPVSPGNDDGPVGLEMTSEPCNEEALRCINPVFAGIVIFRCVETVQGERGRRFPTSLGESHRPHLLDRLGHNPVCNLSPILRNPLDC